MPAYVIEALRRLANVQVLLCPDCFISYSHKDQAFAERLYANLQHHGLSCLFVPDDLEIGDWRWEQINDPLLLRGKLLVILPEHSVESRWLQEEVWWALHKEWLPPKKHHPLHLPAGGHHDHYQPSPGRRPPCEAPHWRLHRLERS